MLPMMSWVLTPAPASTSLVTVLVSSLAAPRDIYRAYTQCYLGAGDTVDTVLEEMEAAGWDLHTLALSSQGYVIQHGV